MTTFAENRVVYDGTQENVIMPPDAIMANGLIPAHKGGRGQSLPANWLNWLFREIFRLIGRDKTSNAAGVGLFTTGDAIIELVAYDKAAPSKYLYAVGYKPISGAHSLTVVASSGLALGTATADGNQPVTGGTNVITLGRSR